MKQGQSQYLQLTLFLILLSAAAYAGLNWLKSQPKSQPESTTTQIPTVTVVVPTLSRNNTPAPTVTGVVRQPADNTPAPTPTFKSFTSSADNFSITYPSSRKLYQDTESDKINRYTFYRSDSNFAVHVGREAWSWEHPNRDFSGNFLVSGQNTFRFQTAGQTIVDIDKNGLKYTIQCIHSDQPVLISECDNFVKSFKLSL